MAYTNIPKPTTTNYLNVNPNGRQVFNDALVSFDDSQVFYDSVNINQYTNISKPSSTSYTNISKPV